MQKGIDEGVFGNEVSSHEAVVLFWVSLSGLLNLKERSLAMKRGNVLSADSIIGSVDFDTLYKKCQDYLLTVLSQGKRRAARFRTEPKASGRPIKEAKAVRRK